MYIHIIWLYSKIPRYITKYTYVKCISYTTISIITNLYCNRVNNFLEYTKICIVIKINCLLKNTLNKNEFV